APGSCLSPLSPQVHSRSQHLTPHLFAASPESPLLAEDAAPRTATGFPKVRKSMKVWKIFKLLKIWKTYNSWWSDYVICLFSLETWTLAPLILLVVKPLCSFWLCGTPRNMYFSICRTISFCWLRGTF
uniref:Uncharacterized protein n=1 Tax=Aegilops tauschii subsp. strangulata TaxID=200361 RepID=A0A453ADV5_AEGTS